MRAIVIQHVEFEGPGLIAGALDAVGAEFDVVDATDDRARVAAEDSDCLVVLGGPMGAHDDAEHGHLRWERDLIARFVAEDRPVLGVCLGAQLLAASAGARVRRGPSPEIGTGVVALTPDGDRDPVLGPGGPRLPVVHWHQDTFDLPAHATLLAGSDQYARQAFRVGTSYGLQFHVELDAAARRRIGPHLPPGVTMDAALAEDAAVAGAELLARWADHAVTAVGALR